MRACKVLCIGASCVSAAFAIDYHQSKLGNKIPEGMARKTIKVTDVASANDGVNYSDIIKGKRSAKDYAYTIQGEFDGKVFTDPLNCQVVTHKGLDNDEYCERRCFQNACVATMFGLAAIAIRPRLPLKPTLAVSGLLAAASTINFLQIPKDDNFDPDKPLTTKKVFMMDIFNRKDIGWDYSNILDSISPFVWSLKYEGKETKIHAIMPTFTYATIQGQFEDGKFVNPKECSIYKHDSTDLIKVSRQSGCMNATLAALVGLLALL